MRTTDKVYLGKHFCTFNTIAKINDGLGIRFKIGPGIAEILMRWEDEKIKKKEGLKNYKIYT